MIHLHTHSMYSLRDSIIKPEELVKRLKEIGQTAVAITDHGGSLGGVYLYKVLSEAGIKYIHGVEFYICDDVKIKDKDSKYYHLVALCQNEQGRLNMNKLISLSENPENKYYKPRIDFEMLSKYGDGLIIMSACMAGEVSRALLSGDTEKAETIAKKYKERFGDRYYLEIQSHNVEQQIELNKQIYQLAKKLDIDCVVTCDAHYTYNEDAKYQAKYAFYGSYKEADESYVDCFVQSEQEVIDRLWYFDKKDIQNFIHNTHTIADRCSVSMPLSAPIMPKIDTPQEYRNNREWLEAICKQGFIDKLNIDVDKQCVYDPTRVIFQPVCDEDGMIIRYDERPLSQETISKYINRYLYELDSLTRMGFVDYILLVYSYANVVERRGIARGSGGGSLICYVTNITDIDPIEHRLYFERFVDVGALKLLEKGEISPKELKIPDIDLDFSGDCCTEVLKFLYNKYGEDKVASIGKFGTNKTKGTIRDMCRALNIDLETADKIAKSFEDYEIDTIDAMIDGTIDKTGSAKDAISYVKQYPELFDYVRKLNGLPKSFGLHACGKIIATRELDYYLPSCYDTDGVRFLQGDMHDVEDVGLVKIDVLGLRTLDQEYDTLEMSKETKAFINPKQDYKDELVLNVFRNGDTYGIFQFSSPGMRKTLEKMDVSGIDDISAANALFRPGAMQYIDDYCRRKAGKERFQYLHPDLEPILKPTYGIIVFQEQLIEIGRYAGIHNPDLLRKATGKKNPKLLAEVKPELENCLKSKGWSEEQFNQLWSDMLDFANYSFNKSHSSAYAILAYMTAKQKVYYPAEFFAGLCNSYIGQSSFVKDDAGDLFADAKKHKVYLYPFNWRDDHRKCSVKEGRLLYAIPLIRDCNSNTADVLYQHRDDNIQHFWQLASALVADGMEQSKLQILIKLDFFSDFGNSNELLRVFDLLEFFKFGQRLSIKKNQISDDIIYNIVEKNSVSHNQKGEELKTFKELDTTAILNECEDMIAQCGIEDLDFKNKAVTQAKYLGFVSLLTGVEEDRPKLYVRNLIPLKRKKDGAQFGYSVICQSVGSGIESRFTIFNRTFKNEPIEQGDVIYCRHYYRDGAYFVIDSYSKIFR